MFLTNNSSLAIIEGNHRVTHHQVAQRAMQLAKSSQIEDNSKIAIFAENRRGWVYAFYAGWIANSVVVPIDYLANAKEVAYILNDSKPEIIYITQTTKAVLEKALPDITYSIKTVYIETFENAPINNEINAFRFNPNLEKIAVIIYTSGTTGYPKGVMLSFNNLLYNILGVTTETHILLPTDVTFVLLPLHHILPLLGCVIAPLHLGGALVFAPSMNPEEIVQSIADNKVTIIIGVPRLYAAFRKAIMSKIESNIIAKALFIIADNINSYAFSQKIFNKVHQKFGGSIRYMISGGASLDLQVGEDMKVLGFKILEGYGMTEAAPMISFLRPDEIIVGSVGKAPMSSKIEIRDGEIVTKGANVMVGYYNRPEESAEVVKDGWLYTGDLGYLDKKGNLYITGRKKEIIVLSNGKNINPHLIEIEIEAKYPIIKEIGLFVKNDQLHAIIVPNLVELSILGIVEIEEYILHNVIDRYNNEAISYKKIVHFSLISDDLPRTRLGKLQRFKLANLEEYRSEEVSIEPEFDEFNIIKEYLAREKRIEIKGKHHLEFDLGLDSLEKVSFQVFIKSTFGVSLDVIEMINFGNVLELSNHIRLHRVKMEVEEVNWHEILKNDIDLKLPKTWWSIHLITLLFKLLLKLTFKMQGYGNKNIPTSPCIIVSNHQSYFDGPILSAYLSCSQVRKTLYYAKEKHVSKMWQKFIAKKHNIIIMDKNKELQESIQMMAQGLKQGKNIVIFPEGTRTNSGRLGEFKKTYTILAKELNIPIVPVVIKGAFEGLPRGSRIPIFGQKVSIEFLKPIEPADLDYETLNIKTRDAIMEGLKR